MGSTLKDAGTAPGIIGQVLRDISQTLRDKAQL